MENKQLDAKQILKKAKATLQKRGWCQYQLCDDEGRVCLAGAVNVAEYGSPEYTFHTAAEDEACRPALKKLMELVRPSSPTLQHLVSWNNTEGRTKEEVLAVLDQAIKQS